MLLSQAIDGFVLDCRARNLSPATIDRAYKPGLSHLSLFLTDPALNSITTTDLRRFVVDLQESNKFAAGTHPWMEEISDSPLSPWTVHRYVRTIKTFFKWCVEENLLPANPSDGVKYPNTPRQGRVEIFSKDEIEKLLKAARKTSFRNYAIVFLLLDTGLRREELIRLVLDDVNVASGSVEIRHGKGDKFRRVRMGNACRKVQWRYIAEFRKPLHENVQAYFLSRSGRSISYEALGCLLRRLGEKLGIGVYAHKFRHTFATMYAKQTPNAILLADALGHSTLKMARWYVHLAGTESTDATSPMDALLGGEF